MNRKEMTMFLNDGMLTRLLRRFQAVYCTSINDMIEYCSS